MEKPMIQVHPEERRSRVRHHFKLRLRCKSLDVSDWAWHGECQDLCTEGIRLAIERSFQPQTVLQIELESANPLPLNSLLARVRWAARNDAGGWFLGCTLLHSLRDDDISSLIGESTGPHSVQLRRAADEIVSRDRHKTPTVSRTLTASRLLTSQSPPPAIGSVESLRNRVGKKTMEIRLPSRLKNRESTVETINQLAAPTAEAAPAPRSTPEAPPRPATPDVNRQPAPPAPREPEVAAPAEPPAAEKKARVSQELLDRLAGQLEKDDLLEARKTLLAVLEQDPGDAESLGLLAYIHDHTDGPGQVGELRCLAGHRSPVNCVAFAPDGQLAFTGSGGEYVDGFYTDGVDRTVGIWDTLTGRVIGRFKEQMSPVVAIASAPGGNHLIAASRNGNLYYIDARDVSIFRTIVSLRQGVFAIAFSADGKHFLSGSDDGVVRLWDLMGKRVRRYEGHNAAVTSVALSADGQRVLAGSLDGTVRLWDAATGAPLLCCEGHGKSVLGVAFTPDGRQAISGSADASIRIWNLENGCAVRCLEGHTQGVTSVAVAPDGQRVLSGSGDRTVRLWDMASGAELRCFTGHSDAVKSVALSPGGRRALSGSADKSVRVWRLPP
jgi:hypothetical protein